MRMDSTVATKMATIVLLTATVFLLADSVAGSRLQSIPGAFVSVNSNLTNWRQWLWAEKWSLYAQIDRVAANAQTTSVYLHFE